MQTSYVVVAAAALAVASGAQAQSTELIPPLTVMGSTSLVSQYRFRGISLSDEEAAIQGTINITHKSDVYTGFWASTLDGFGEPGGSNLELDLYGGYKVPVGSSTLDVGLLYYAYPGSSGGDFEFFEPYANVSGAVGPATYKVGVNYAWDQDALGGNSNIYIYGDTSAALPGTPITLKAHLGYSNGDTPLSPTGDYLDWLLGADLKWRNLTLGVAYVDTDISSAANRALLDPNRNITDAAVVAALTASF